MHLLYGDGWGVGQGMVLQRREQRVHSAGYGAPPSHHRFPQCKLVIYEDKAKNLNFSVKFWCVCIDSLLFLAILQFTRGW